jgi:two-component system sensor histidine kinase HydH
MEPQISAMPKWIRRRLWRRPLGLSKYALLLTSVALPLILVLHSVLATRELKKMQFIFLRDRAATIAATVEAMPPEMLARGDFDNVYESEPGLVRLRVFRRNGGGWDDPSVTAIWAGKSLYSAGIVKDGAREVFRAYLPFHASGEVNIAQIDLSLSTADLVLVHARHNIITTLVSSSALVILSLYALWSIKRAARLEAKRVEMEGLANLGRLSAVLAHEIRNPLGSIKGFAQLASESADERMRKPLDAIVRESRRLERLVNELLLFGKPIRPAFRVVEWEPLAAELGFQARQSIGGRPIQFATQSQIRKLSTDPDLLKQVLCNLIRNSVEAIPESTLGEISLDAATSDSGTTVVTILDNGSGIPDAIRKKLFEPFTTTKASGTGLGLAISKRLMEALGGELRFSAVAPHGTKAEVILHGTYSGN